MLSVVILTKNEEQNIIDCLETVSWADEIIIIDDNSIDRTVEIIRSANNKKIKIIEHSLEENFAQQRNFGLSKATKKWVLFLDADERITSRLREEINIIIIEDQKYVNGYFLKRNDFLWGKMLRHGETNNLELLRLARRGSGIWIGDVHEEWIIDGKTEALENPIFHYPHQTVNEFLKEINFYSTLRAKELLKSSTKVNPYYILIYPLGKFIYNYFIKLGFLDGIEGLIFGIFMSFHSFLVRSKLWILYQRN